MKDCNCIFCKIANGEIPSTTLYEDEDFRVILDLGPEGNSGGKENGWQDEGCAGSRRI